MLCVTILTTEPECRPSMHLAGLVVRPSSLYLEAAMLLMLGYRLQSLHSLLHLV